MEQELIEQALIQKKKLAKKSYDYKWRASHREQYNKYVASQMTKYRAKNQELICKKGRERYAIKKEFDRFLKILL